MFMMPVRRLRLSESRINRGFRGHSWYRECLFLHTFLRLGFGTVFWVGIFLIWVDGDLGYDF